MRKGQPFPTYTNGPQNVVEMAAAAHHRKRKHPNEASTRRWSFCPFFVHHVMIMKMRVTKIETAAAMTAQSCNPENMQMGHLSCL